MDRNGAGVLAVAVAADEELQARAAEAGADPLDDLLATGERLERPWRVSDRTDDEGLRTVTLSAAFADPEELADLSAEVADALNADEVDLLDPFAVTLTDDEVTVSGGARMAPTRVVRDYGLTPRRAVRLIERTDAFAYSVAVTMPAEVTAAGATVAEDGRTATWEVAPGEEVALSSTSVRPGPPLVRAVLGAGAGAVLAGGALWLLARRRRAG